MIARDIMTEEVISIKPNTPIRQIIELLMKHKISGVPVLNEGDKIIGVVTEADLLYRKQKFISTEEAYNFGDYIDFKDAADGERKAKGITAEDIMSTNPICVKGNAQLSEIASIMIERSIKRVFVVIDERVIGVVSKSDILRKMAGIDKSKKIQTETKSSAGIVMTKDVIIVHKDAPVYEVIKILLKNKISGLPVVDEEGKVLGIISESDLIYKEKSLNPKSTYWSDREKYIEEHWRTVGTTAGEIMSKSAIIAEQGASTEKLVSLMFEHNVNRIPILKKGKLVGIVSRADLLKTID